jgi:hypothetical protein
MYLFSAIFENRIVCHAKAQVSVRVALEVADPHLWQRTSCKFKSHSSVIALSYLPLILFPPVDSQHLVKSSFLSHFRPKHFGGRSSTVFDIANRQHVQEIW